MEKMQWKQLLSAKRFGQKSQNEHTSTRSFFEQDYDRIIFSHPFRRLQDKTQVVPLPEEDFVHTRLTHSLEVSSVGRSLGKKVGEALLEKYPELEKSGFSSFDVGAIVAAASLTHDIGNPPFGHSGEDAISYFFSSSSIGQHIKQQVTEAQWKDLTTFEGNAQGFRLLNLPNSAGTKLTFATLAAFSKYPRASVIEKVEKGRRSQKKYGFFQSEWPLFQELAEDTGLLQMSANHNTWVRHPLAFLVEAADDICYHIIDLEDGYQLGWVSYQEAHDLLAAILGERFQPEKLEKVGSEEEKIAYLRALAINTLIGQCVTLFMEKEEAILTGDFDISLMDLIPAKDVLADIIKLSVKKIYQSKVVLETEAAGHEVLDGLLQAFVTAAYNRKYSDKISKKDATIFKLLPEVYQKGIKQTDDVYELCRQCTDYVAGMTDRYAITLYRKLRGISLPT